MTQSSATGPVVLAIRRIVATGRSPVVIALDGRSGSGKSTLAAAIAADVGAVVVPSDDFFAANITRAEWDARDGQARARDAIDWRRLRRDALEPLRRGQPARWYPFDFDAGERADGTYATRTDFVERLPAPVIILDGAYSSRPELADLIDLSVLVDVALDVRDARLALRESANFLAAWHDRWDVAEDYYFTKVRPPSAFDLVVQSSTRE